MARRPRYLVALITAAVVVAVAVALAPTVLEERHTNAAINNGMQEAAFAFQTRLKQWAAHHDGAYPPEMEFTKEGLGLSAWPINPFTGGPMSRGRHPGGFIYELGPGDTSFRLTLYGDDGVVYRTVSEP